MNGILIRGLNSPNMAPLGKSEKAFLGPAPCAQCTRADGSYGRATHWASWNQKDFVEREAKTGVKKDKPFLKTA